MKQKATLGALGFCTFCFFSLVFLLCFFIAKTPRFLSKQKNQSCEKNFGEVHSGLLFLVYLVFLDVFAVPSPTVQNSRKNKKNNPVRRILGKSIQDCFFWFIWFFSRFLLSQAQLSKNSRQQNYLCRMTYIYIYSKEVWMRNFRVTKF